MANKKAVPSVIAIANPKGGVGKSTLATNLAGMFASRKHKVRFFGADAQRSGDKWCLLREGLGVRPLIELVDRQGNMYDQLVALRAEDGVTVVDVTGSTGKELTYAVSVADVTIVPVVPGQFEVWALDDAAKAIDGVRETGANPKMYAVLNNASYNKHSRDVKDTRAALNAYQAYFSLCETVIVGKQVYKDALRCGLSVVEMDGGTRDPKATENLNSFFSEIF